MKTSPETLVEEIAEDFNSYVSKGVQVGEVLRDVDPNLNIEDIEQVLRIHFVLTESTDDSVGVITFVDDLREKVRRIKTSVTKNTEFFENEVRGRIDWQQTIKQRYRSASPGTGYACTQTQENYNIDENLVLKQLLSVIHEIVFEDLKPAIDNPDEYPWLEPWVGTEQVRTAFDNVFHENIYLQRIKLEDERVTDRMIESVKNSRNKLYRDAAELLDRYRRLTRQDLNETEAKELLRHTFVRPSENARLFELYWAFQLLNEYDDPTFKLIQEDADALIAEWEEDGWLYRMYHDSVGGMTFSEDVDLEDAPEDGYFRRLVRVENRFGELQEEFFDRGSGDDLWGGRPDILIEKYRLDEDGEEAGLEQLFVGEVKYTQDPGYAAQGLRELLEYMALVKEREDYVESNEANIYQSDRLKGAVFVDSLSDERRRIDDNTEVVTIDEAGERKYGL